ncbi:MAG: bifunctional adenosylcobinamide kinase/adenosylcobinamide-phosphate guanylyltransferase [Lachnospiraceae bacterium]
MKILISGGCKNGKSTYAQVLAKAQQEKIGSVPLYYVATMKPYDKEDEARISRHIEERKGMGFETIEIEKDILELKMLCKQNCSILLDSTTALLMNEMFQENNIDLMCYKKIGTEFEELLRYFNDIVIVSDGIYSDAIIYSKETKEYRKALAYIDKICAKHCEIVIEACFGNFIYHKGISMKK